MTRTDIFRAGAVRRALTSGLTRKQVASDLGVGLSTLNKWVTAHRYTDLVSDQDLDLAGRTNGFDERTAFSRRRGGF
jgi:transposase